MNSYFTYVIKNTNDGRFAACRKEELTESLASNMIFNSFEEACRVARIYNHGNEPIDKTRHH